MKKPLTVTHPELLEEWSKDNSLDPNVLTFGSGKKAVWICKKCGHNWEARIDKRTSGTGCPVCANQIVVSGINDLATTHPELLKDWSKDNTVSFTEISAGSKKVVSWSCHNCGRNWKTRVFKRGREGQGCNCNLRPINTSLSKLYPELLKDWDYEKNNIPPDMVSYGSEKKVFWNCVKCDNKWEATVNNRVNGTGCPKCSLSKTVSKPEKDLQRFIKGLLKEEVLFNDRSVIAPSELDIYIPSKSIAVEFNGLYWHSEDKVDKQYHYDKFVQCREKGVQLLQIWEDDWLHRRPVVEKMLENKLGVSNKKRTGARLTVVKEVTSEAKRFLGEHHIQGGAVIGKSIGLFSEERLLAVLQYRRRDDETVEILRFAGDGVQGGFSKLLKNLIQRESPTVIITFSDNMVSDGGLYSSLGFVEEDVLAPDYYYVYKGRRHHKFGFRKKRFKNDPDLLFEEDLTERELAILNNIPRVWDAGKVRWRLDV